MSQLGVRTMIQLTWIIIITKCDVPAPCSMQYFLGLSDHTLTSLFLVIILSIFACSLACLVYMPSGGMVAKLMKVFFMKYTV